MLFDLAVGITAVAALILFATAGRVRWHEPPLRRLAWDLPGDIPDDIPIPGLGRVRKRRVAHGPLTAARTGPLAWVWADPGVPALPAAGPAAVALYGTPATQRLEAIRA